MVALHELKTLVLAAWGILAVTLLVECRLQRMKVFPKIHGIWTCPDKKHFVDIESCKVNIHDDGSESIDVKGTMTTDIKTLSKFVIIIHRCTGAVSENTCEYFTSFIWRTGLCQLLKAKGVLWSPLIASVHPKFECPMKNGSYRIINGTVNYDQMGDIMGPGAEKYVWKGELQMYNERNEMAVCGNAVAEIRRVLVKHR